jgi:hypothetical protein
MRLRGTLGAVLSHGNVEESPFANTHPEWAMGSEFEPTEIASAGILDDPASPGYAKPPTH